MTLSDLVFGKDFKLGHCFHSIPSPTSRMFPYSDIFADLRGFPSPTVTSHSSTHLGCDVSPSGTGSPQPGGHSPSPHGGGSFTSYESSCSAKPVQQHTSEEEMTSEEQRSFKCPQCRYVTDRKNNLKRHIVTMHQECAKTLECCGVVFQSKSLLRDHVGLFHRGGYRCQICSRNFCRKALLRRHLTVHSGRKDFSCDLCGYATSHKSNLERHQKVHSRKPTSQIAANLQPLLGLSVDYSNIILAPAKRTMMSHNARFLPRYRLLPDRLKQTHVTTKVEVQTKTKWTTNVSRSSKNHLQHSYVFQNNNNHCRKINDIETEANVTTTRIHSAPAETKGNTDSEKAFNYFENATKRPKIQNEITTSKSSENNSKTVTPKLIKPGHGQDSCSLNDNTDCILTGLKSRSRMCKTKCRIYETPYKCPVCSENFCFQLDLSSHQCTHAVEDNISVITAVRKGKLKLSPN